jgi:hypothetical protein
MENNCGKIVVCGELPFRNFFFGAKNPLRQQRRKFCVTQEAAGCLEVSRGSARRCSVWSHDSSTGSPSKAMDKATCRGIRCQRIRCRVAKSNSRHRLMFSVHFMSV